MNQDTQNDSDKATIACVGWGSLIWDRNNLPVRRKWHEDGPLLPVEFARESNDKRITLVIHPDLPRARTLWCLLDVTDTDIAKNALASRERAGKAASDTWIATNIGFWDRKSGKQDGREADTVAGWATHLGLDGVVWTNLPWKFNSTSGGFPSEDEVVAYLRTLTGDERSKAESYVRKAPPQIDTPYRRRIVQELGWTYSP